MKKITIKIITIHKQEGYNLSKKTKRQQEQIKSVKEEMNKNEVRGNKQFQWDNRNNFMRYQSRQENQAQHAGKSPTRFRSQIMKYRQLLSQLEDESFYDDSLFFDKRNLFSLVNPPSKKIKTIYHKIILSNKNDPLHPSSFRKYEQQGKTKSQNRDREVGREVEGNESNKNVGNLQVGNMGMFNNVKDNLKQKNQTLSKDKKQFFKNLLKKFTQSPQKTSSIHYKQQIHLFKKIFQHYKIKPEQKQHFDELFKKISQKQLITLNPQSKLSTKINLQCRKNNHSVSQKRAISPKQMKLMIKEKLANTSRYRRSVLQKNDLSNMSSIEATTNTHNQHRVIIIDDNEVLKIEGQQAHKGNEQQISSRNSQYLTVQQMGQVLPDCLMHSKKRTKVFQKRLNVNFVQTNKQQTSTDIKLHKFREFLFAVNFSNHLFVPLQVQKYPTTFKVFIGKGNNSNLIKSIFKKRFWFQVTKNIQQANFIWTQLKQGLIFKNQIPKKQILCSKSSQKQQQMKENNENLESIQRITLQTPLNLEISSQTERDNIPPQDIFNQPYTTKEIKSIDFKSLKMRKKPVLSQFISVESERMNLSHKKSDKLNDQSITRENIIKIKKHPQILMLKNINKTNDPLSKILCPQQLKQYQILYAKIINISIKHNGSKISSFQQRKNDIISNINGIAIKQVDKIKQKIHNHLPFNGILGNKKAMFYILREYCDLTQKELFNIVPLTFHIKHGLKDEQYKKFLQQFESRKKTKKINYWVMKPGEFSNRGNGIQCTNKIQQIKKRVHGCVNHKSNQKKAQSSSLSSKSLILQSYITDILLYNGRKFDIRAYMMITIVNGKIKAYWYEQGYIRTSSYIWNLNDIEDREIHLTNDAVQKYSDTYGKYEMGNKLSYRDIQRYLEANQKVTKNVVYEEILPQMKQIAVLCLKASYLFLDPAKLQNNFQIFGLDFMLDTKLKPWLIEINTNPCLELGCPILQRIIPNMLQNAFRIAIDPLFPPPSAFSLNYKYNIAQNAVNYNKFELIFDQDRDGPEIKKLYENRSLQEILRKIEDIQQDKEIFEEDGDEIDLTGQI